MDANIVIFVIMVLVVEWTTWLTMSLCMRYLLISLMCVHLAAVCSELSEDSVCGSALGS